jgi:hypothetical protein
VKTKSVKEEDYLGQNYVGPIREAVRACGTTSHILVKDGSKQEKHW